jgi:hypothetical protein
MPEDVFSTHDQMLFLAEKIGEMNDRLVGMETEFTAQAAPLTASKGAQDAALSALSAALVGIKALNFHVLDNNLGHVSKRVEAVAGDAEKRAAELAKLIDETRTELTKAKAASIRELATVKGERIELSKRVETERTNFGTAIESVRVELGKIQSELAERIGEAVKQFAVPASLNPKGPWDALTSYSKLDLVSLNGTSYVSNVAGNIDKPDAKSKNWTLIARRGGSAIGGGATDITGVVGMGATGLQIAQSGTPAEARTVIEVEDFTGATSMVDGTAGRVIQPVAGDQNKYLRADGTWTTPSTVTAPAATQATVDAGVVDDEFVSPLTLAGNVLPKLFQRRMTPRVVSNGATTNRGRILTPGAIGNVAGLPITIEFEGLVPTSNPSSEIYLFRMSSSTTDTTTQLANGLLGWVSSAGSLFIRQQGTTSGSGAFSRSFSWSSTFRSTYSGSYIRGTIAFTAGDSTTTPTIHIKGVDVTSNFSETVGASAPTWMPTTLVNTYLLDGFNWIAGDSPTARVVIGAYSDAEAVTWTAGGQRPAWAERAGTAVVQTSGTLTIGCRYYIKSYVASDSFTNVGAGSNATAVSFTATGTTPTTWTNSSQLVPAGLIDNPHPQPGLTSFDSLGRMSRRNVGHVNVTDRDTFTIYANTSTSGNEQALGGALFESANNVTIDLIEQATATGTPTTTIGSASGGAQYKASGALSAGLNVFTPVTRKPASTSVWVGSDDTTTVRTIIHGHKATVPVS